MRLKILLIGLMLMFVPMALAQEVAVADSDGDGWADDIDCSPFDATRGGPENSLALCSDGVDNDCNGLIDAKDPACSAFVSATQTQSKSMVQKDIKPVVPVYQIKPVQKPIIKKVSVPPRQIYKPFYFNFRGFWSRR